MAGEAPSLEEIRLRLIERIEADEWRITEKAERMGREFLRRFIPVPTQLSTVNHVLNLLKQPDCSLIEVLMGTPNRSGGIAHRIRDPMSPNLSDKVTIEEDRA